jgi:DNA-binding CsgD family transcriptional regulator
MTPSELHVARLAAVGLSNSAIARARGTSPRTVANQMARVLRELGVASRRALAVHPTLRPAIPPPAPSTLDAQAWESISVVERSILALTSRGELQKCIAIELGIAPSTVSAALHSARRRLGFASISELTRAFAEHGCPEPRTLVAA